MKKSLELWVGCVAGALSDYDRARRLIAKHGCGCCREELDNAETAILKT
jgi:hypothetical protein